MRRFTTVGSFLFPLLFGCGGGTSELFVPKDPTPLAKCKVAASAESPLVTEWPASEKARLEGRLSEGGVAVSYSGCEMTILDDCKIEGSYLFQRTTLSTDTLEIRDADELYAKLPLGALGLEGELARTGRLAVRTTVVGQMKLQADPTKPPQGAACSRATHLVNAISVGAFKLLSGGALRAGGGVSVAGVGTGTQVSRAEEVMREAGSAQACSETTSESPNPSCNSPIQVFLSPLSIAPPQPMVVPGQPPQPYYPQQPYPQTQPYTQPQLQPGEAVQMSFAAQANEHWTLKYGDGSVACELPCSHPISSKYEYYLELQANEGGIKQIKLPTDKYQPGQKVDVGILPPRGALALGIVGISVGGATVFGGAVASLAIGTFHDRDDPSPPNYAPALIALGIGAVLTAGGVWLTIYSRGKHKLDYRLAAPARPTTPVVTQMRFGPGFVTGSF